MGERPKKPLATDAAPTSDSDHRDEEQLRRDWWEHEPTEHEHQLNEAWWSCWDEREAREEAEAKLAVTQDRRSTALVTSSSQGNAGSISSDDDKSSSSPIDDTPKPRRQNILSPVIKKAIAETDGTLPAVWATLREMALEEQPPLLMPKGEVIEYSDVKGRRAELTYEQLRKRLERLAEQPAKGR
jgi:hypothetical protein